MRPTNRATLPLRDRPAPSARRRPRRGPPRRCWCRRRLALRLGRVRVVAMTGIFAATRSSSGVIESGLTGLIARPWKPMHHHVFEIALLLGELALERAEHLRLDAELLLGLLHALHRDVPEVGRVVGHERELGRARRRSRPAALPDFLQPGAPIVVIAANATIRPGGPRCASSSSSSVCPLYSRSGTFLSFRDDASAAFQASSTRMLPSVSAQVIAGHAGSSAGAVGHQLSLDGVGRLFGRIATVSGSCAVAKDRESWSPGTGACSAGSRDRA